MANNIASASGDTAQHDDHEYDIVEHPVKFYAQVDYEDAYVQPLIVEALKSRLEEGSYEIVTTLLEDTAKPLLQIRQYESIGFDRALRQPNNFLINSYVIRKALIRKHYLTATVRHRLTKNPDTILKTNVAEAYELELDYAEFLDEALVELYELQESLESNLSLPEEERTWWILKPSMADRGQGIRLFSSEEELRAIFEEWDDDEEEEENEEETSGGEELADRLANVLTLNDNNTDSYRVVTSQLRHFVVQPYIHPPLLLPDFKNRKFHIRTYVIAVGALKVWVYKPMLALSAAAEYEAPWINNDLKIHLTNTHLQGSNVQEGSVRPFSTLSDSVPGLGDDWKDKVFNQITEVTGELFAAAARNQQVNFQALPNSFELFGLDFLVDDKGTAWLLEVNAFPDFKQTGDELKDIIQGLFEEVVDVAIKPFFKITPEPARTDRAVKVLDIDLGRK